MPNRKRNWRELGRFDLVETSNQALEERVCLYTRQSFKTWGRIRISQQDCAKFELMKG